MDIVEAVRERRGTELDRLGSEKALVAATDARLDRETVLGAAAAAEGRARDTFAAWADDEPSEPAREAFAAAAETERDHHDRVVALLEDPDTGVDTEPDPLHAHLRGLDDTVERVGAGLVARPLVASRSLLQFVNYAVNEADDEAATLFRDLRGATDAQVETGVDLVSRVSADEDGRERAVEAAAAAVLVAYEAYADRLTGLGIDPKPVC